MPRFNVRCCCQPQKILGTLELQTSARDQYLMEYRPLSVPLYASLDSPISEPTVETHPIKLRFYREHLDAELELAVYSDDRPVEFWRKFETFVEAPNTARIAKDLNHIALRYMEFLLDSHISSLLSLPCLKNNSDLSSP